MPKSDGIRHRFLVSPCRPCQDRGAALCGRQPNSRRSDCNVHVSSNVLRPEAGGAETILPDGQGKVVGK
jgi:hypothetical protein